jgi:predicted XRE-type DNA-binding protein
MSNRNTKPKKARVERGSGNVFADLGLPDAEERLAKANLAHKICALIAAAGLTQTAAAKQLGIDQPKVSMLIRGRLKDFSTERLMNFLVMLGQDVVIDVREPEDRKHPSMRVLVEA